MRKIGVFWCFLISLCIHAQQNGFDSSYAQLIERAALKKHVFVLASDSLQGRGVGQSGEIKAAQYISSHFKRYGLKPYNDTTYYQPMPLRRWYWGDCFVTVNNKKLINYEEMGYMSFVPIEDLVSTECVFVGYGDALDELDLNNKVAFAFVKNLRLRYHLADDLKKHGAKAVFVANPTNEMQFESLINQQKYIYNTKRIFKDNRFLSAYGAKTFIFKAETAATLFGLPLDSLTKITGYKDLATLPTPVVSYQCPVIVEEFATNNVIGYVPGTTDGNEALVITAHYDHVGKVGKHLFPGADDNASGTAALMELARVFAELSVKPYKHILFVATTAEEEGLWGASYFVNHSKLHPFDIRANINIDMIGRRDSVRKKNYVYLIGTKYHPEFMELHKKANQLIKPLQLDYTYDNQTGFGNLLNLSDHYAFHKNNIPIIAFFGGLHKDYHEVTDTPDKIDYSEMSRRVKLIFATAFLAAQQNTFNK